MVPLSNHRRPFDPLIRDIAAYSLARRKPRREALEMARWCLMDSLGCAFDALGSPDCRAHLGPLSPGMRVPHGARVPGTTYELDPIKAAFDTTCLIRWLDFSDTWLSGGHPSDNIGALLAIGDHLSRRAASGLGKPVTMAALLDALIRAYEIHGLLGNVIAVDHPDIGMDNTFLVKIASTAMSTRLLGGGEGEMVNAISNAFIDSHGTNIHRMGATAGSRKSWSAADAASRGAWLAFMAMRGEMGYPGALTTPQWGFESVRLRGKPFPRPPRYGDEVVRRIMFKLSYPAQRHAQTAAECAVALHPEVGHRIADIRRIRIATHALARRMISVKGPLPNFAARDHCLEYVVSVALLHGTVTNGSYEDQFAADPRIDRLRGMTEVTVNDTYTRAYEDPRDRANPNCIEVEFVDGSRTRRVEVKYPLGDPHRRRDGIPALRRKFAVNVARAFAPKRCSAMTKTLENLPMLAAMPVHEFMDLLIPA